MIDLLALHQIEHYIGSDDSLAHTIHQQNYSDEGMVPLNRSHIALHDNDDHHGLPGNTAHPTSYHEHSVYSDSVTPCYSTEHIHNSAGGGAVFGDPVDDVVTWHHQAGHKSCAVVAQMGVYESITHQHMTEQQFCDYAEAHGWYDPHTGTPPQCVGNVLNSLGIPTDQHYGGSLTEIADTLARGDKVIVGVNANDIWHPIHTADGTPIPRPLAGHAVWVTGLNVSPDGTATVYLNDSGTAHGGMMAVDARDFLTAWREYGNMTVITHAS